jgi:hypothetical protein
MIKRQGMRRGQALLNLTDSFCGVHIPSSGFSRLRRKFMDLATLGAGGNFGILFCYFVQEFRKSLATVFAQLIYGIFAGGIILHYSHPP